MRLKIVCITAVLSCCVLAGCNNQNGEPMHVVQTDNSVYVYDSDDMECEYEIEKVFCDNDFYNIIEGEDIPVEIIYGIGGEGGYEQYSTKAPEMTTTFMFLRQR